MLTKISKIILVLIVSACTCFKVYADTLNALKSKDIDAYIKEIDDDVIYSYDVSWGSMNFNYIEEEKFILNEHTNEYERVINNSWVCEENFIDITNDSTFAISILLTYNSVIDSVSGEFKDNSFKLEKNENKKTYLNLNGSLNNEVNEYINVGNILMEVE